MSLGILAGLTMEHILLADLMSDTAIRLIEASRPENLRKLSKEEANELMKVLHEKRDALRERQKKHQKTGE